MLKNWKTFHYKIMDGTEIVCKIKRPDMCKGEKKCKYKLLFSFLT